MQMRVSSLEAEKSGWKADVFEKGMEITNKMIEGHKEAQDALHNRIAAQEEVIEQLRQEVQQWREAAAENARVCVSCPAWCRVARRVPGQRIKRP